MKFRPFSLECECGLAPAKIKQVGLSAEHQLVIHWWCPRCRKAIYVVKDLSDCWLESPSPDQADEVAESPAGPERYRTDEAFLRSMGICLPSDDDKEIVETARRRPLPDGFCSLVSSKQPAFRTARLIRFVNPFWNSTSLVL